MRKNKNTKSADDRIFSPKNRAADLLVVLFCLGGMALCLWLFRQDLYRTLSRLNVKPVGTVILKRGIAQRRFESRTLWDHLQKTTPVYVGDFIRTAENSGAVITLIGDDAVANLDENTIIQITMVKETGESRINLFNGTAALSAGSGGTVFTSGNTTLVLAPGSAVSAAVDGAADGEGGLAFRVDEGSAIFTGSEGTVKTFQAGEGAGRIPNPLPASPAGGTSSGAVPAAPRLIVPTGGEAFPDSDSGEISFRWTTGDDDRIALYLFELADNPAMENAAVTMRVSGRRIALPGPGKGRWYWRVTPVYAGNSPAVPSAAVSFTIGEIAEIGEIGETAPAVPGANAAAGAGVEAAGAEAAGPGPGGTGRKGEQSGAGNAAALQNAAGRDTVSQNAAAGQTAPARLPALSPPRGMRPGNGSVLGPAELRASRTIAFSWNPVPGATAYVFSLYREADGERRRIEVVEVQAAGHVFTGLNLLERGTFVWTVQALRAGNDGTVERGDAAESRFVVDIPVLQRRELPETGILYGE
jgi:hypothetical protein